MKQLTILCSSDLSGVVHEALVKAGVEGFLNLPGGTGVKPGAAAPHGRDPRWPAEMFIAPVADPVVPKVMAALGAYAGKCDMEPCLRILVSPLEEVR